MSATAFDRDQAAAYLAFHFEDVPGYVEGRFLARDGRKPRQFWARHWGELLDPCAEAVADRYDCYVGMATRTHSGGGKKADVRALRSLWLDHDSHGDRGAQEALEVALETFYSPPSMRVWSGGGDHVYWRFEEPLELRDAKTVARVEFILRGLASQLEGDPAVCDVARIMRVPGTINWKHTNGSGPVMARWLS